jgi:hypothetical protein
VLVLEVEPLVVECTVVMKWKHIVVEVDHIELEEVEHIVVEQGSQSASCPTPNSVEER